MENTNHFTNDETNQEVTNSNSSNPSLPSRDVFVPSTSHRRILQNFRLVWLNNDIEKTKNEDSTNTNERLRQVIDNVTKFTDIDTCIEFIKNVQNEKVFLICSEEFGQTIIPIIHENVLVHAIYILSKDQSREEDWVKPWVKIKGIFTDVSHICEVLKDARKICDHNMIPISFVKQTSGSSKQDLDTLDPSFMYTQIMKEILLTIEFDQTHIDEFLTYCRKQLIDNNGELRNLDKIEKEYFDHQPIWWYTYSSFLYSILNRALRLMEVDLIIKMGFFLKDLHNNIVTLHTAQFGEHHHLDSFVVYRGQGLSQLGFDELQQTQGGLLSFNSFLSTSFDRAVSFMFAESIQSSPDIVGVLFEITIDPSISLSPFANIKDISYFEQEEEILFSMHAVFRIGQIRQIEENNRVWQVNLVLTTDTDPQLLSLTECIREETEGSVGWFRLGRLMMKIGEHDKAEDLYNTLLSIATDEREQDRIYYHLGVLMYYRGEYMNAISAYENSLKLREKRFTLEDPDVATCYNGIGSVYNEMGEYAKALSYYDKTVGIQQKTLPENHPHLAASYNNIGLMYNNMEEYSKALSYYEKTLKIYQKNLPENHPYLAISYNNIGLAYNNLEEYSKALSYYEKVLEICQKSLPEDHPHLATSYNNVGLVYNNMGEYPKALSYYEKALEIYRITFPEHHHKLTTTYNNIAKVYYNMTDYSTALSYLQDALNILQQSLPNNHPSIQNVLQGIDIVKKKL